MKRGRLTLISGGARSGKSHAAHQLALHAGSTRLFIATAQAWDDEMRARIRAHQHERGRDFQTLEVPMHLADALAPLSNSFDVILIDCLTLWITNLLLAGWDEEAIGREIEAGLQTAQSKARDVILVSKEVGLGIVPDNALARTFRDVSGRMQQKIAGQAQRIYLVFMGRALPLHQLGRDLQELVHDE